MNKTKIINKIFSKNYCDNHLIYNVLFLKFKFKKQITNEEIMLKINSILENSTNLNINLEKYESALLSIFNKIEPKMEKSILPFLSVHLVDKCNNNCESCSHFCTLADDFVLNINDYRKDIAILSQKFFIQEIDLMGGEPLLHPQITSFFDITREILPSTNICLHTNGILLPSMPDNFWKSCNKNKISFKITKYPVIKNFSKIIDLCLSNDIYISGIINGNEFLHWMDKSGNGVIEKNFRACKSKFGYCYILRNSKLYTCPTACYMDYYNSYFNTSLPVEQGIDIIDYSDKEILDYLNLPVQNCQYCKNVLELSRKPWRKTSKNIDEWEDKKKEKLV